MEQCFRWEGGRGAIIGTFKEIIGWALAVSLTPSRMFTLFGMAKKIHPSITKWKLHFARIIHVRQCLRLDGVEIHGTLEKHG